MSRCLHRRRQYVASIGHLVVMVTLLCVAVVGLTEGKEEDSTPGTCNLPDSEECRNETCNPKESEGKCQNEGSDFVFDQGASILDYLRPSLFEDPSTMEDISQSLKDGKLVVIKNAFDPDLAEYMWKHLSRDDIEFDLLEGVWDDGFHYHHHNIQETGPKWTDTMQNLKSMFFNPKSKEFMTELSGRDCMSSIAGGGAGSVSHYMIDDHSLPHSDYIERRTVAFVWHLSKDWEPEYGGGLYWFNAHNHNPFVHASFNTLNLFSVTPNSTHFVTMVSKEAEGQRLTMNGWYESEWEPKVEEPIEEMSDKERLGLSYVQLNAIETMDLSSVEDEERQSKLRSFQRLLGMQLQKNNDPNIIVVEPAKKEPASAANTFAFKEDASIVDYLNPSLIEDPETMDMISRSLKDGKLVIIKDAFQSDLAEYMWQDLSRGDLEWDLLQGGFDDGFHYHHHNIQEHSHKFSNSMKQLKAMFGNRKSKQFMSELTGRDCTSEADSPGSASHYMVGDHSLPHSDYQDKQTVAYVWHLAKNWDPRWGGAFYWCPSHHREPFIHASFNTLILHTVSPNSTHFVTAVHSEATEKRLAFNGWYESDWMPDLKESVEDMPEEQRLSLTAGQLLSIVDADLEDVADPERKQKLGAFQKLLIQQMGKDEDPDILFA